MTSSTPESAPRPEPKRRSAVAGLVAEVLNREPSSDSPALDDEAEKRMAFVTRWFDQQTRSAMSQEDKQHIGSVLAEVRWCLDSLVERLKRAEGRWAQLQETGVGRLMNDDRRKIRAEEVEPLRAALRETDLTDEELGAHLALLADPKDGSLAHLERIIYHQRKRLAQLEQSNASLKANAERGFAHEPHEVQSKIRSLEHGRDLVVEQMQVLRKALAHERHWHEHVCPSESCPSVGVDA